MVDLNGTKEDKAVRVLCVDLSAADERAYQRLYGKASPERRHRADRCRRRADALRCVAADALLRRVLGDLADAVEKTPAGKPYLPGRDDLHFNLSHGGSWVVLAWGGSPVGVDVESLRTDTNIDRMAGRFFAEGERRYVLEREEDSRRRFFEVWTGKESYLKYLGTGLTKDLTSFSILDLEPPLKIHLAFLPDGSPLSLCTTERVYRLEYIDVQDL